MPTPKQNVVNLYPRAFVVDLGGSYAKNPLAYHLNNERYLVYLGDNEHGARMFAPSHRSPRLAWEMAWWCIQGKP